MAEEDPKINFRRISDQSALIQNVDKIKDDRYRYFDPNPTKSVFVSGLESLQSPGDGDGFSINKLYNFKEFIDAFNKLDPASLSALNPYLEIYKVYEDESERIIPFNNFYPKASIDALFSSRSDRGYQANIQDVKFTSQGKDTATTFIYQVEMKFIFDSIQTLFHPDSKYIELFNPPKKHRFKRGDADPKYYQIKLKYGWNVDIATLANTQLKTRELKKFADASSSEVFLNYVKHVVSVNEDGSVHLSIEYIGSLEIEARNPNKFSMLSDGGMNELKDITEKIDNLESSLKERGFTTTQTTDEDKTTVKILRDEKEENIPEKQQLEDLYNQKRSKEGNNSKNFQEAIIKNIALQYSGPLRKDEITNYHTTFPVLYINDSVYQERKKLVESSGLNQLEVSNIIKQLTKLENEKESVWFSSGLDSGLSFEEQGKITDYLNKLEYPEVQIDANTLGKAIKDVKYYRIPFFTFRNLLKALEALYGIDKESDFVMLGVDCSIASFKTGELISANKMAEDPEYKIYVDNGLVAGKENLAFIANKTTRVNIMDIPIALSTFRYWFNKNIKAQDLSQMSLINFLNLCVNELLVLATSPVNADYVPRQNLKFSFFFDKLVLNNDNKLLDAIKKNQYDQNSYKNIPLEEGLSLIETNISPSKEIKKNIVIFYTSAKFNSRKSNIQKDIKDGIPYFFYGANKGIVNKITFREENIPFFREANIQSQVDRKPWRPGVFLRSKYNATIELMGTVNFRVGSMVYISPSLPGVINTAEPIEYGIGGYFVVVSNNMQIESGKYVTVLECNWVATGTGEYTDLSHAPFKVITLPKPLEQIQSEEEQKEKELAVERQTGDTEDRGG
jgi:hypothetical protein